MDGLFFVGYRMQAAVCVVCTACFGLKRRRWSPSCSCRVQIGGAAGELLVGNDHGGFIDGRGGEDILVGGLGSEILYG